MMKEAIAMVPVIVAVWVGAVFAVGPQATEWEVTRITEGKYEGETFQGTGKITSTEELSDFHFQCKLTWDKSNPKDASFGFYFGVPAENEKPFFQVIVNEKMGRPTLSLVDYSGYGTNTGKTFATSTLPRPLAAMGKFALTVKKKGNRVQVGIGNKALTETTLPEDRKGKLQIIMVSGKIKCESISVKGL